MTERRRYTIEELKRLRPPTATLSIPRRPMRSPARSPPPIGRSRASPLSGSPPSLRPSSYDEVGVNLNVNMSMGLSSLNTRSASPLLSRTSTQSQVPPGFGLSRASTGKTSISGLGGSNNNNNTSGITNGNGGNGNINSGSNNTLLNHGRAAERRIARGPNPSANFATRIAFAATRKQKSPSSQSHIQTQTVPKQLSQLETPTDNLPTSIHPHTHNIQVGHDHVQQKLSRRDFELTSEIDRLFSSEVNGAKSTDDTQSQSQSPTLPKAQNHVPTKASPNSPHPNVEDGDVKNATTPQPSSLEDAAVTLASVAYMPQDSGTTTTTTTKTAPAATSTLPTNEDGEGQADVEMSFDEFAKELASGAQTRVIERDNEDESSNFNNNTNTTNNNNCAANERDSERQDPTVEALAKWFSSLAAAVDVVEGTDGDDEQKEGIRQVSVPAQAEVVANMVANALDDDDDDIGDVMVNSTIPALNNMNGDNKEGHDGIDVNTTGIPSDQVVMQTVQEVKDEDVEESKKADEKIDESVVTFIESVWKRAIDGDMMEWAQGYDVNEDRKGDDYVDIELEVDDLLEQELMYNTTATTPVVVQSV